jgi:transposase
MNNKQYRTYTEEFKLEALELLESSDKSAAQIERDLGITKGLLLKWRDRYQVKREGGQAQAEIKRLRRQLRVAEEERDILKKAVSIFSKLER